MFRSSAANGNQCAISTIREYESSAGGQAFTDLITLKFKAEQKDTGACSKLFEIYENGKPPVKKIIKWL